VIVLEAIPSREIRIELVEAARLAGPVLWRIAAIEAHRRSTEQLDEQRAVLTSIVNSLPDPIVIINAEHEIVVQNRRAEHLLSMGEEDSEGRRRAVEINNLLFTSHLSKTAIAPGSSVAPGSRELNMVDPDEGSDLLFEVLTQPLDEDEGATVSVLRDVTDLRRAAGELERQVQRVRLAEFEAKRERDRLNLILTNVADPILVTDDRSNIILMNRQAELLFGSAAPVTVGAPTHPVAASAAGTRSAAVRANDTKFTTFISDFALSTDTARREEMTLLVPGSDGKTFPAEVVSGKILDRRGEPIAIVSVLHDLTEQAENERLYEELKKFSNELEGRVRAATADLAEQNVRLQWQSRELEKANRLKSEFLASMSHELRTPINALIGYTALLLDRIYGELTDRQEEGLTRIQAAAQHLLALINDILDLAKIEAGRMPLHLDTVTLQDLVREVTLQIEPLVKKKGLSYRWITPSELVEMHTDRTKVKQIVLNLLSNAVKFTHAGTVTLTAQREGSMVRIDVADTGIGIRKEDLGAIWEDFRQVDQSRTREFGGTGLGLSITRKLVDALGGRVSLVSEYGVGSTFSVFLPVRSEPRPERAPSPLSYGPPATLTDER
jgi:signal transduction histidine kinase